MTAWPGNNTQTLLDHRSCRNLRRLRSCQDDELAQWTETVEERRDELTARGCEEDTTGTSKLLQLLADVAFRTIDVADPMLAVSPRSDEGD